MTSRIKIRLIFELNASGMSQNDIVYYSIIKQVAHCSWNGGSWQTGIVAHSHWIGGSFGYRLFSMLIKIMFILF